MLGTWMRFAVQSMLLGLEAQRVMILRTTAIAQGGSRAQAEMQRMIVEKLVALTWAGAMVTLGKPTTSVIRHYRARVRANERRLSARKARNL
jgi:hypothetical protein